MSPIEEGGARRAEESRGRVVAIGRGIGDGPRVCLLAESYPPGRGARAARVAALASRLAEDLGPVVVVTRRAAPELGRVETRSGVTIRRGPPAGSGRLFRACFAVTSFFMLVRWRREYDLIVVDDLDRLGLAARLAALLVRKPEVFWAREGGFLRGSLPPGGADQARRAPLARWRDRVCRGAAAFVASSPRTERRLIASGVAPAKIRRVPESLDVARNRAPHPEYRARMRERLGWGDDEFVAVSSAEGLSYNRARFVLSVWSEVVDEVPNARLVLASRVDMRFEGRRESLRHLVRTHGLSGSVAIVVGPEETSSSIQSSDLFISLGEGGGGHLRSAMACGVACVASGDDEEISFEEGRDGLTYSPDDSSTLVDAVTRLASDRDLRERLGREARKTASARFSDTAVAAQYVQLIHEVLGQARGRGGAAPERGGES